MAYIRAVNSALNNWILLFVLSAIWGSSFILMKLGMETTTGDHIFTHTQVAALRMSLAGIFLLPFAIKGIRKLTWRNGILLAVVGTFGNFLPAFLFTYSETGISSGYAGMLNSCTPIFALIIGFTLFKNRLNRIQMIGVFIGTVGIVALTLAGQGISMTGSWTHVLAVVIATFFYAVSLNTIKYTLQHLKSVEITALSFLIILLPSILISIYSGVFETLNSNPYAMEGLGYIAILSAIGTALAVIIFNRLISNSSVLFASSVTYLIPVVALFIGMGFGEKINSLQIASMGLILIGVFVANVIGNRYYRKKAARQLAQELTADTTL